VDLFVWNSSELRYENLQQSRFIEQVQYESYSAHQPFFLRKLRLVRSRDLLDGPVDSGCRTELRLPISDRR